MRPKIRCLKDNNGYATGQVIHPTRILGEQLLATKLWEVVDEEPQQAEPQRKRGRPRKDFSYGP